MYLNIQSLGKDNVDDATATVKLLLVVTKVDEDRWLDTEVNSFCWHLSDCVLHLTKKTTTVIFYRK